MKILELILSDKKNRKELIKTFQNQIWKDDDANDLLRDLALDLDYYEPDENLRNEDPSYYGDEKLESEILEVLSKLKEL